jgi:hypothetical protein
MGGADFEDQAGSDYFEDVSEAQKATSALKKKSIFKFFIMFSNIVHWCKYLFCYITMEIRKNVFSINHLCFDFDVFIM